MPHDCRRREALDDLLAQPDLVQGLARFAELRQAQAEVATALGS